MTTYKLGSSKMVYAPGMVAWAKNGYVFKKDRKAILGVITGGWGVPIAAAKALLSGKVAYKVEGEVVVFTA